MAIATAYDLDTAVFLQNIAFWIKTNKANDKHHYDGYTWTYNSLKAFKEIFPCWSSRQLERITNNCVKAGLLIKGNYNKSAYDRTVWYTLTEKGLKLFNINNETPSFPISPNGEINLTERGNQFHRTVKPIPDNKPDIKTDKREEKQKISLTKDFMIDEETIQKIERIPDLTPIEKQVEHAKFFSHYLGNQEIRLDWNQVYLSWFLKAVSFKLNKYPNTNRMYEKYNPTAHLPR